MPTKERYRKIRDDGLCVDCGKLNPNGKARCLECYGRYLQKTYNVSEEFARDHLANPVGICELCQIEAKLVIDHCHESGSFRGRICDPCNKSLGHFEQAEGRNPDWVERVRVYLAKLSKIG